MLSKQQLAQMREKINNKKQAINLLLYLILLFREAREECRKEHIKLHRIEYDSKGIKCVIAELDDTVVIDLTINGNSILTNFNANSSYYKTRNIIPYCDKIISFCFRMEKLFPSIVAESDFIE